MSSTKDLLRLSDENYYTREADRVYMSCSQYQSFLECEAATMAKLYDLYTPTPTEALLVGNYFHTALESDEAHEKFCEEHFAEIYKLKTDKKTGETSITGKYAAFERADKMIQVALEDPLIRRMILSPGENEVIMTGELFGTPWKVRFDKYDRQNRSIIDWKTAADLTKTAYDAEKNERVSFLEFLGYLMRAAIYIEIERQNSGLQTDALFTIAAISKEDPPDKGAWNLNHRQRLDYELQKVSEKMPHILAVKRGRIKPKRCGSCEWCRKTKKLREIRPYYELTPAFKPEREDEYDDIFAAYMEKAQTSFE